MLQRPIFGKLLAIAELLFFAICSGVAIYCLYLTRSPDIRRDPDSAEAVRGLKIGAAVVFGAGLVFGIAGFAFLRRKRWGWWLGLIGSIVGAVWLAANQIQEKNSDLDEWFLTIAFFVATAWFFVPGVRNYLVAPKAATVVEPLETPTHG